MVFRIIFLFIFVGILSLVDQVSFDQKIYIFLFCTAIILIFDLYTLKKVEFHIFLSVGISLIISLSVVYLISELFFKLDVNSYMEKSLYQTIVYSFTLICIYVGIQIGVSSDYFMKKAKNGGNVAKKCLVDTSAIIDGRLLAIEESGFVPKSLVIPRFVIRELQLISDSTDHDKRIKGRRGLDLLKQMKNSNNLSIQISNEDIATIKTVDSKLVALCKKENYKIITTDFNLFKVAQLEGIEVMNINHLANLIKPNLNVGDKLRVFISKKGNNKNQGIAFFPDDTMIIVENGEKLIGSQIGVVVISYIQNESGRMAFAKIANN